MRNQCCIITKQILNITMETMLHSTFLDDREIAGRIYEMLANDILGKEQMEKIKLRSDKTGAKGCCLGVQSGIRAF